MSDNHLERSAQPPHQDLPPGGQAALPYGAWLPSPGPAEEEAGRLRHYLRVARDQRWTLLGVLGGVVALVALATALTRPMYESTATVLVRGASPIVPAATGVSSAISDLFNVSFDDSIQTQAAVLESKTVQDRTLERCGLERAPRSDYAIEAQPAGNARVVEVRARARRPQLAARLANTAVAEYLALDREINRESAGQAAAFVADQLDQVETKLTDAQRRLRDFKEKSGTVALDSQTQEMVGRFAQVQADYETALAARAAAQARIAQARQQLREVDPSVIASVTIAPSPEAQQLRDTVTRLETQRAQLLQEYVPTSETVRALDAQIEDAKQRLADLARRDADTILDEQRETLNPIHQSLLQDLTVQEGNRLASDVRSRLLAGLVRRQQAQLERLPQTEFELANLTRDVQTFASLFSLLTAKQQELRISQESELPTARQLDVAEPERNPVSPRWLLNLALAVVLGAVLAVMAALTRDQLDERVKSDTDVARALAAPVMGHVLSAASPPALVSEGPQPSALGEAYRVLRSNVMLSAPMKSGPVQTLLITSAAPQEGKSMTAANLAVVLARQGCSVILVDGDLRRPTLHQRFGLGNEAGLSTVLAGEAALDEVLRETPIPHLRLLPAGPAPDNPPDLLASERAQRVIAALRQRADLVIFDSPPSLALSDAQILASRLDGVLLVVDTDVALKRGLLRLREQMDQAGAHLLGAVLNRVHPGRGAFGETYYRYYSQYWGPGRAPAGGGRERTGRELPPADPDAPTA